MIIKKLSINPEIAQIILNNNKHNRPIKARHLDFLCSEMRNNKWKSNGDTIRIAKDGTLIDGQHRLKAIVITGVTIDSILVTDLELSAFDTIDCGAKRSSGDTLSVAGEKNGRNLSAALIVADDLLSGKTDFIRTTRISNSEVLAMLRRHEEIRNSIPWGKKLARLSPASITIAMHYIFSMIDNDDANCFFDYLSSGLELSFDSPIYLLRKRLIDNATSKSKLTRRYICALFIKAWNYYHSRKKVKFLVFREVGDYQEKFPEIDGA